MSALTETKKSFRVLAKSIWDNGWPFHSSVKVELVFSDRPDIRFTIFNHLWKSSFFLGF